MFDYWRLLPRHTMPPAAPCPGASAAALMVAPAFLTPGTEVPRQLEAMGITDPFVQ